MCVHAMVYVAFWVVRIAISSARASKPARATSTARVTRQQCLSDTKDVTNKMDVASPTQGKRQQEKRANDIEGYTWIEEGPGKSKQLGKTALLLQ